MLNDEYEQVAQDIKEFREKIKSGSDLYNELEEIIALLKSIPDTVDQVTQKAVTEQLESIHEDVENVGSKISSDANKIETKTEETKSALVEAAEENTEKIRQSSVECADAVKEACKKTMSEMKSNTEGIARYCTELHRSMEEHTKKYEEISEKILQETESLLNHQLLSLCKNMQKKERIHFIILLVIGLIFLGSFAVYFLLK